MLFGSGKPVRFYDSIICGAGPAGSRAAERLAREGFRVLLLEKARLPRYKPCGGGLTLRAVRAAGLDGRDRSVVERWVEGAYCCFDSRWTAAKGSGPVVAMVMRSALDALLVGRAAEAGAEVIDGARVLSVVESRARVEVQTTAGRFAGAYAVGADGACSAVARALKAADAVQLTPAFTAELEPPGGAIHAKYSSMALYDLGCVRGGFGWAFPKAGLYSVGICSPHAAPGELRRLFRRFIESHGFLRECAARSFKGWFIPLPKNRSAAASLRTILAGDAAGCVDPFSGEGIPHALRSGEVAAGFLARRLREGAGPGLDSYRTLLDREVLRDLRIARLLGAVFYAFPRLAFRAAIEDPRAVRYFAALMAGEKRYADILKIVVRAFYKIKWLRR